MSSEDPIASASKGVAEAVLDWTTDKLKELIIKFKHRDIAFVEDIETIEVAKKQRKTSEWDFFKEHVKDNDLRILFQMGLTLRKFEKDRERVKSLRYQIRNKYDSEGLHIAQFVQNGFFARYIGIIWDRSATPQQLKSEIENLFNNLEKAVIFIRRQDDVDKITDKIVTKIHVNSPKTFIISSTESAMGKCRKIKKNVMKRISDYDSELVKTDIKEIYFLTKSDS